ncbi:MAG TPA: 50S ribosomal protein L21 [Candidatus Binatia bacterium]|jgi:large subunit ribosomal protein L21|nr:50S ribosomal protein L21 [Candidatus Binatia bacterium]
MAQFAVIQTGGKQYLVKEGDALRVEKLDAKEGDSLSFDPLLVMDENGKDVKVGAPSVKGASVSAKVTGAGKADKVTIIKFHAKTRYKRKAGHRQPFTALKIESIKA